MTRTRIGTIVSVLALLAWGSACAGAQRAGRGERRVRLAMAEQLGRRGEWGAAFQAANAVCQEDPEDGAACLLRARALRRTGAVVEAEAGLAALLARDPSNAEAHAELAVLCELARRPEEALRHHREALRLERSARHLNNLGFALYLRNQAREAIPLFEEALRAAPEDERLRNNLGFALAATGDFPRAARQFELGGSAAQARNNLGLAYELAHNLPQAYDSYLEAVRLEPGAGAPRDNLERVARELGRSAPAPAAGAGQIGGGS